jgi:hypothetical protein
MLALLMARFLPVVGGAAWTVVSLLALGAGVFAVTIAAQPSAARVSG